jgi:phosphoserine phosphatase RsbU/P
MKIMIVDDDQEYAEGMFFILESEGYVPEIVDNARSAIEMLDKHCPDILLVDWEMPNMSGLEFLKYIRSDQKYQQKYIIMISGKSTLADKVMGIDAGADDYLTKPCESQELLARLRAAVRIINLQKEKIEKERLNTVLEMALSIADKIGNPLAAARMLQQFIKINIHDPLKVAESIENLGTVLLEAQDLVIKYQSIKTPKSIPAPLGNMMIDPGK